jgi:uncharacterized protein DUF4388
MNESDFTDVRTRGPSGAFRARLQGVSLQDFIQVENMAHFTGVFAVLSRDRVGYLHMLDGELIHAEADGLAGEAAALAILSWHEGELRDCERALAQQATVMASLPALLVRLAKVTDEHRRSVDSSIWSTDTRSGDDLTKPGARKTSTRRTSAMSRATRLSADGLSRAEVLLNRQGQLLDGRGDAYDELASEVVNAARLAEFIGQALGAGKTRALGVHGKASEVLIRWLPNANLLGISRGASSALPSHSTGHDVSPASAGG